jgi:hypothetical protein
LRFSRAATLLGSAVWTIDCPNIVHILALKLVSLFLGLLVEVRHGSIGVMSGVGTINSDVVHSFIPWHLGELFLLLLLLSLSLFFLVSFFLFLFFSLDFGLFDSNLEILTSLVDNVADEDYVG